MNFLRVFFFLYFFFGSFTTLAQIWPGDVNNNGITNNVDLLWYGTLFNNMGPARQFSQQGIQWENKNLTNLWPDDFPNGTNHAFADCDGDGTVEFEDAFAITFNYNKTHNTVTPDVFIQGIEGIDPPLFFTSNTDPSQIIEGNPVVLSVNLGTDAFPIDDFFGIAFTIRYDPTLFSPNFGGGSFALNNDSWVGLDVENVDFDYKDPINGRVEAGIVRKNIGNVSGFGALGNFFIVIEDHVVGMSEPSLETKIWLENVRLINDTLVETIVFADSINITILNDDIINSTAIEELDGLKIFPNPANRNLWIESEYQNIQRIELFNLAGQSMANCYQQKEANNSVVLNIQSVSKGIYFLKIVTTNKIITQKIMIGD